MPHSSDTDLFFAGSSEAADRQLARRAANGELRRIVPGIYTNDLTSGLGDITHSPRVWQILAHRYPGRVVGFRSAMERQPYRNGEIWLVGGTGRRTVELPGVSVHLQPGPDPLPSDQAFFKALWMPSDARMLLENLVVSRPRKGLAKSLGREAVQGRLEQIALRDGFEAILALARRAGRLAPDLGLERESGVLTEMAEALAGQRSVAGVLTASTRLPRSGELPVHPGVRDRLDELAATLSRAGLRPGSRPVTETAEETRNRAFAEAWFSNEIEGVRFPADQARESVFHGRRAPECSPGDIQDLLGTYELAVGDMAASVPESLSDLIELLITRHGRIMSGRPEASPGQFRDTAVFADNYEFMDPALIRGTLAYGFERLQRIEAPPARAVFLHYLLTEVHPFLDGNGRVARLTANAELSAAGEARSIITPAMQSEYLNALRLLSLGGDPEPLVRMTEKGQAVAARVDFSSWESMQRDLVAIGASPDSTD